MNSYLIIFPEGKVFVDDGIGSIEAAVETYYTGLVNSYNDDRKYDVLRMDTDDLVDTLSEIGGNYGACQIYKLDEAIAAIKREDRVSNLEKSEVVNQLLSGVGLKQVSLEPYRGALSEVNTVSL